MAVHGHAFLAPLSLSCYGKPHRAASAASLSARCIVPGGSISPDPTAKDPATTPPIPPPMPRAILDPEPSRAAPGAAPGAPQVPILCGPLTASQETAPIATSAASATAVAITAPSAPRAAHTIADGALAGRDVSRGESFLGVISSFDDEQRDRHGRHPAQPRQGGLDPQGAGESATAAGPGGDRGGAGRRSGHPGDRAAPDRPDDPGLPRGRRRDFAVPR